MVMLEAKVLLDDKSLSVKQIANVLNFENPFHFSLFLNSMSGCHRWHTERGGTGVERKP